MHEPPEIPNFGRQGTGEKIKPGMTLAIEPDGQPRRLQDEDAL